MKILSVFLLPLLLACSPTPASTQAETLPLPAQKLPVSLIDTAGISVMTRFRCPEGFERIEASSSSFAQYLRTLPLKKHGTQVRAYDGRIKPSRGVYTAVVDLPIGNRDLHQCADAVMRLRAEYLYHQQRYEDIHFNFTNGFRVDYSRWMAGDRISVSGNDVRWRRSASPSTSPESFWKYLETIFAYAGTLSLEKELNPVEVNDLQIGDVWIKGGSPGHAIIVVDVAIHQETGEKIFMLAQSYMPAQEIQVLLNPNDSGVSPWYRIPEGEVFSTPEWRFSTDQLRRF